ncbi:hypothetical protein [Bacillus sp. NPDC094106]|uniref:hypothetical protein n=1 Tax=Bacillus sp. NPDC094106 TaxID=3363949 RepID=UPI003803E5A4
MNSNNYETLFMIGLTSMSLMALVKGNLFTYFIILLLYTVIITIIHFYLNYKKSKTKKTLLIEECVRENFTKLINDSFYKVYENQHPKEIEEKFLETVREMNIIIHRHGAGNKSSFKDRCLKGFYKEDIRFFTMFGEYACTVNLLKDGTGKMENLDQISDIDFDKALKGI